MDELVGLAAVQQSSDGWERVQNDGLRVGINIVLKQRCKHLNNFNFYLFITIIYVHNNKSE